MLELLRSPSSRLITPRPNRGSGTWSLFIKTVKKFWNPLLFMYSCLGYGSFFFFFCQEAKYTYQLFAKKKLGNYWCFHFKKASHLSSPSFKKSRFLIKNTISFSNSLIILLSLPTSISAGRLKLSHCSILHTACICSPVHCCSCVRVDYVAVTRFNSSAMFIHRWCCKFRKHCV